MSQCLEEQATLAARFRCGDPAALGEVQARYGRAMFVTALSLLGDRDLAEETVQDALVRAWQAAGRFDASRELAPWLYQIVRRCAVNVHRRHRGRPPALSLDELPVEPGSPAAEPSAERGQAVRAAVRELDPPLRAVIELAYFDGLGQAEIAARLGVPIGTVKSRTSRAHHRLAELLGRGAGGGPGGVRPAAGRGPRAVRGTPAE